jgi:PAS domain S-box-containing protein
VGELGHNVPWFFLAGGLAGAALAAAIVETLARRRTYALALVGERTIELQTTLDELGATRAFLEHLLTSGPVVVTRTNAADLRLTHVSANIERIFGLAESDALTPGYLAGRIHPDDLHEFELAMERLLTQDTRQEIVEYRLRHGDGEYRSCTTTAIPETSEDGEIVAFLSYTLDVSARRRAEEAQRQAQEAAEAANKAKSEFLSRMSHELRTPLNAVLGFGQLLELEDLDDSKRDAVQHILKAGGHLLDLINEVLDISRIEAGEMSLSPEPVLAAELVQEAADLIRPLADQRGIQLVVDGSGACNCYMFADRQRAKQVLLNLLSNAVKYNRPGGTVAVSCDQPSDTRLQISVDDTGGGIAAERLGLLFTPFERLGAEHTGEEGTGIGLALSRRLAEAMGGTLEATSTLGRGSTFTVELPRVEGPVERYERLNRDPVSPEPASDRRVVLHIEDNLSNATLVERVLAQRPGVEVVAAMHGRLGLELAREHQPALVLLDLHLPDMDGEHVLQRLRDDPATASIPVVIVSADVTAGQVQRLLSAGASAYLTKPIDVRDLLRHVDEAVADA